MREPNLRNLKLLSAKIAAAAVIAGLLAGCAAVSPVTKNPAAVKSQVMVTLSSPNGKLKKKCTLLWSEPFFRMEIRGFLNEPVVGLSADNERLKIYFYQTNLFYDEQVMNAGPAICRLFSGKGNNPFELKLSKNTLRFKLAYTASGDNAELPYIVELYGKEGSARISFIKPDTSYNFTRDSFPLKIPANAVKISEEALMRSFETWIN